MTTDSLGARSQRGLALAREKQKLFHRIDEERWIVPSATCSQHAYLVDASRSTCTCPDSDSGATCKHLWAVAYIQNEIILIDGTRLVAPPVANDEEAPTKFLSQDGAS